MVESVFEPDLDMEEYLSSRVLEIQNLSERKLFKDVVEKLLLELHHHTQAEYHALEDRVFGELQSVQNDYAISIGLTDLAHFDATDSFLQPIFKEDTQKQEYPVAELLGDMKAGRPYPLHSIFLEADCQTVDKFAQSGRIYQGVVSTEHGEFRAKYAIRPNRKYLDRIEQLYHVFNTNFLPWTTICTAYLYKFFQVELLEVEDMDTKEVIQEVRVDFEEFQDAVRYHYIPLWNLVQVKEKTSTYPEPCMDKINFDHRIFAHRLDAECQYLVANSEIELLNIRRVHGDLILSCPDENPHQWILYRVNRPTKRSSSLYPVLSNLSMESFAGNLSERYRRGVKTKAEIARILSAYPYGDYVCFQDVTLLPSGKEAGQTYQMDEFLLDELRIECKNTDMLLTFTSSQPEYFLTKDIMSFLVSQIQELFPEYSCIGRLV